MKIKIIIDHEFDTEESEDRKLFEALTKTFIDNWYAPKKKLNISSDKEIVG
jgi:hypothetical protein